MYVTFCCGHDDGLGETVDRARVDLEFVAEFDAMTCSQDEIGRDDRSAANVDYL